MNSATAIDLGTWPRRQHFEHYRSVVPCTYAMTVELDVTDFVQVIAGTSCKTYLAQIWALAAVVNRHSEFRMCVQADGSPAVWDVVHPSFTIFHPETETFSSLWTPFDEDFATFHDAATAVIAEHGKSAELFPQGNPPPNSFDVSSLPWASFTAFSLNIAGGWDHLAPIFTLGKYVQRDDKTLLPLALQVHHAAIDGFHVSRFVNEVQEVLSGHSWRR